VPLRILAFGVVLLLIGIDGALGAVDYSSVGSTYTQNFNSLSASGTENPWTNDSTIVGWHLFRVTANNNATPFPMALYDASDGSSSEGRFYSYGTNADRALGGLGNPNFGYSGDRAISLPANQAIGWITASIANNTGGTLTRFTLAYDGEQWSDAGDNEPPYAQTMKFEYGFGSTFPSVPTWVAPAANFTFTSQVYTTTARPIDGNGIGRVPNLGGTITDVAWQPGTTLWLRWVETNDSGADAALAIDNFSFSGGLSAVPEASAILFGGLLCVVGGAVHAGRKLLRARPTSSAAQN
jgi:hypothetical protein